MENLNPEIADLITQTSALGWSDTPPPPVIPPINPVAPPLSLTLVGKILSSQPLSKVTIKSNISLAWKILKSLISEDTDDNLIVFTFEDLEDLTRVLENSPSNINGSFLYLKKW
jgi:hypothetical protein